MSVTSSRAHAVVSVKRTPLLIGTGACKADGAGAAELYREQIGLGLDGDPRAALRSGASCANSAARSSSSRTRTEAYGPVSICTPPRCFRRPQGQLVGATGFVLSLRYRSVSA